MLCLGTAQFIPGYGQCSNNSALSKNDFFQIISNSKSNKISGIDFGLAYDDSFYEITSDKKFEIGSEINNFIKFSESDLLNENKRIRFEDKLEILLKNKSICLMLHSINDLNSDIVSDFISIYQKRCGIGISIYTVDDLIFALNKGVKLEYVQLPINTLNQSFFASGALEHLKRINVNVVARSLFLQGLLFFSAEEIQKHKYYKEIKGALDGQRENAELIGVPLHVLGLGWVRYLKDSGLVDSLAIGVQSFEQYRQICDYLDESHISGEIFERVVETVSCEARFVDPRFW